jgi:hypothetical protein
MDRFKGELFIQGLKQLKNEEDLKFPGMTAKYETRFEFRRLIKSIEKKKWSGYAKSPFSRPEKVLEYLGRYTHRVAISNYRIKRLENRNVTFTWKDCSDNNTTKEMTLKAEEFIRRFLLHVLPRGFKKNPVLWFSFSSI